MSKTSRFLIGVMVAGLAFMAGLRAWQLYERRAEAEARRPPQTATFHHVPVDRTPRAQPRRAFVPYPQEGAQADVYLEEGPISSQAQKLQAEQTLHSVLADYKDHPKLRAFYAELKQATGREDIDLVALSGPRLPQLLKDHPQVQEVMAKYAKDPEFAQTLQEIFNNPQFVQSVLVLQQQGAAGGATGLQRN